VQVFITRPVMAVAVNLILVILGIVALKELPLKNKASVPQYSVEIVTNYPGASNRIIEQRITKPLENALSGIDGIKNITSKSIDGNSSIKVKLTPTKNYEKIISNIRDRIQGETSFLPDDAMKPAIFDQAGNDENIMYLKFSDPSLSNTSLYDYIDKNIIDNLKMIDGVAKIDVFGGAMPEIVIEIDPLRLAQLDLNVADILKILSTEKMHASAGQVDSTTGKKTLILSAPFASPADIEQLSILVGTESYKLKDLARVVVREQDVDLVMRVNGKEIIGIGIMAKPNANPMEVVKKVKAYLAQLKKNLPSNMTAEVFHDVTGPFAAGAKEIGYSLIEAIILVGIIVVLALGSFRAAIIPIVTVPLCLISTFFVIWILGFSINPITMLALVLAVGLVVDDAIVVVENIHKHMEDGLTAIQAAKKGMQEITFAIVVMTITLSAVYLPLAFQADETAYLLREFAFTLAGSVLLSGFVALTLTPAMSGRLLAKVSWEKNSSKVELFWAWLDNIYQRYLNFTLSKPKHIVALLVIILGLVWWGYKLVPQELEPVEDEDIVYGWIAYENKVASNVKNAWFENIETAVNTLVPEKQHMVIGRFGDRAFWFSVLQPRKERKVNTWDIAKRLQKTFKTIAGPMIGAVTNYNNQSNDGAGVSLVIQYAGSSDVLHNSLSKVVDELEKNPKFARVNSESLKQASRHKITVLRDLAAELGVSVQNIEDTLYVFFTGKKVFDFLYNSYDYDVKLRAIPELRSDLAAINQFFVKGSAGVSIPLGNLVNIEEILETEVIEHYARIQSGKLNINLAENVAFADALKIIEPVLKQNLPEEAQVLFSGDLEKYQLAKQAMITTFILSLAFIFLVLAALFESFTAPFIVLLTVPLSIVGAIWLIYFIGGTNNLYTQIGMVTLIGLITKHGILITDFANRLRQTGVEIHAAVLQAAAARLRPILMTTLAMVCGAVPLLFSIGSGANARLHLGCVIISGMTIGTIFSLFIVPVFYKIVFKKIPNN
jgi:multidrug efflux pump